MSSSFVAVRDTFVQSGATVWSSSELRFPNLMDLSCDNAWQNSSGIQIDQFLLFSKIPIRVLQSLMPRVQKDWQCVIEEYDVYALCVPSSAHTNHFTPSTPVVVVALHGFVSVAFTTQQQYQAITTSSERSQRSYNARSVLTSINNNRHLSFLRNINPGNVLNIRTDAVCELQFSESSTCLILAKRSCDQQVSMPPVSLDNDFSDQPNMASTGDNLTATSNTTRPPTSSMSNRSSYDPHPEPSELNLEPSFQSQDVPQDESPPQRLLPKRSPRILKLPKRGDDDFSVSTNITAQGADVKPKKRRVSENQGILLLLLILFDQIKQKARPKEGKS